MNILKISRLSMLWFCLLAIACAEDKGNYTYEDKAVITIDSISSMLSVLANAEYIDLKPVVTSNLEGIIDQEMKDPELFLPQACVEMKIKHIMNHASGFGGQHATSIFSAIHS